MASIRIGGVEETQPGIVAVQQKIRESFDAECGLVRVMPRAEGAGAHGEAAGLNTRTAEGDGVGGGKLRHRRLGCKSSQQVLRVEPGGSQARCRANEEFAAMHKD